MKWLEVLGQKESIELILTYCKASSSNARYDGWRFSGLTEVSNELVANFGDDGAVTDPAETIKT